MVQDGTYREKWTLDAWEKAFAEIGTSKEADEFLLKQSIKVTMDLINIPVEALRCVGFTKLYEAGRIDGVTEGEGGGGLTDSQEFNDRHDTNYPDLSDLDENVAPMEAKGMHIYVKLSWTEDTVERLEFLPSDRIWDVKTKIHELQGISTLPAKASRLKSLMVGQSSWKYSTGPVDSHHVLRRTWFSLEI
jgi:hypothetical protein